MIMRSVYYGVVSVHEDDLAYMIDEINRDQDKIVAVTQDGSIFTIFYERGCNLVDGGKDNG